MEDKKNGLIVGIDLRDDFSQISCFNEKTKEPDSICYIGDKMDSVSYTHLDVYKRQTLAWHLLYLG